MSRVSINSFVAIAALIATPVLAKSQVPDSARLTVAVPPFEVRGYTRNRESLAASANLFTEELRRVLAADSTIRLLPARPAQRAPDPVTGRLPAVHNFLVGWIEEGGPGAVVVRWQVAVVADGRVLVSDTLCIGLGRERDGATVVARQVSGALRRSVGQ
jgi:hypothetical protein